MASTSRIDMAMMNQNLDSALLLADVVPSTTRCACPSGLGSAP